MADAPGRAVVPPILYLPVREAGKEPPVVEIRKQPSGELTLLAFTALDRLLDACGYEQPWIFVQTAVLGEFKARQPFEKISFDPVISDQLKRGGRLI